MTPDGVQWMKAHRSYGGGACVEVALWTSAACKHGKCVEVAPAEGGVMVRDSKDPGGPVLTFTVEEFAVFLDGARNGEFDHLVRATPSVRRARGRPPRSAPKFDH